MEAAPSRRPCRAMGSAVRPAAVPPRAQLARMLGAHRATTARAGPVVCRRRSLARTAVLPPSAKAAIAWRVRLAAAAFAAPRVVRPAAQQSAETMISVSRPVPDALIRSDRRARLRLVLPRRRPRRFPQEPVATLEPAPLQPCRARGSPVRPATVPPRARQARTVAAFRATTATVPPARRGPARAARGAPPGTSALQKEPAS